MLQLQAEAEGAATPRVFFNKEARPFRGFVVGLLCGLCTCVVCAPVLTGKRARACVIECDTSAAAAPLAATDEVRKRQKHLHVLLQRSLARRSSAHLLSGTNIQPEHLHVTVCMEQDPTPHERACHLPLGLSAGFSGSLPPVIGAQLDGPRLATGVLYMSRAETNVRDFMMPCQM